MKKALTPKQALIEAKKLIKANDKNVDLIITGINNYLITHLANNSSEIKIKIHFATMKWPNGNWKMQDTETIEKALEEFEKYWFVQKIGEWEESHCHVLFFPRN